MESKKSDNKAKPRPARKPYKKPEFRYERVFETMALACTKLPGAPRCGQTGKHS
jgi:hypothetical protein